MLYKLTAYKWTYEPLENLGIYSWNKKYHYILLPIQISDY